MGASDIDTAKFRGDRQPQFSTILNWIGAVIIVTAIILHIVCLATPHWAAADSDRIKHKVEGMINDMASEVAQAGLNGSQVEDFRKEAQDTGALGNSGFNYGLWKICLHGAASGISFDMCVKWGSKTKSGSDGKPESYGAPGWIRAVQAMAILGLVAAVVAAVMATIHLFVPSRGDRLKLLPIFICITAFVAGAFVICGDIILGAKYKKALEFLAEGEKDSGTVSQGIVDLVESFLSLSWGFALDVVAAVLLLLSGPFYLLGGKAAQRNGLV